MALEILQAVVNLREELCKEPDPLVKLLIEKRIKFLQDEFRKLDDLPDYDLAH